MTDGRDEMSLYLSALIDEFVRVGLRHIVVSPGSRSTPLAVLAAEHPDLQVWMNVDERSAGFFALGMAKARREAVALLCTSGTAAANYMPAVAEASLARVPLVVLTADRPHELRDVGAPQTIDQIELYGDHVKWFMEMPIPEADKHMLRHARVTAARAVGEAMRKPRGPVHLNFPLREPLVPNLDHPLLYGAGREEDRPYVHMTNSEPLPEDAYIRQLAKELSEVERGLIVCGPIDEPDLAAAVMALAEQLAWPVLADPLSQLRSGNHTKHLLVDTYDTILRDDRSARWLRPDVVLRFGAMPVSKPLLQYMQRHADSRLIIVDEGGWRDPTLLTSDMVVSGPRELCRRLLTDLGSHDAKQGTRQWLDDWLRVNEVVRKMLLKGAERSLQGAERSLPDLFEGRVFTELRQLLLPDSVLFAGNSMPIRDLDTFYVADDRSIRMMGNRGANGIDGLISTALGVSAAGERTVLVIGDVSFYHDMNGLLAAKIHQLSLTIIVVNNDGGGIFNFLPQSGLPRHFEQLFGTPLGLDYSYAAQMYGGRFTRIRTWDEFREAFQRGQSEGGLQIIEVPTDRVVNVENHRRLWQEISHKLEQIIGV